MNDHLYNRYLKCFFYAFLFFTASKPLFAQNPTIVIAKEIKLQNKNYYKQYEATVKDLDTLLVGEFSIYSVHNINLTSNTLSTFEYAANYKNNQLHGNWLLSLGDYKCDANATIHNRHLELPLSGKQSQITGTFKNDEKWGNWNYTQFQIHKSQILDTLMNLIFQYKEQGISGKLELNTNKINVKGSVSKQGFANNIWLFYRRTSSGQVELFKEWNFENNSLTSITLHKLGETQVCKLDVGNLNNWKSTNIIIDEKYLKIIALITEMNSDSLSTIGFQEGREFLADIFATVKNWQTQNTKLVDIPFYPEIKTTLPIKPLLNIERLELEELDAELINLNKNIMSLLNDPQINIMGLSEQKVHFLKKVLQKLRKEAVEPLNTLVNYYHSDLLQYIQRNKWVVQNIRIMDSISINLNDSVTETYYFENQIEQHDSLGLKEVGIYAQALSKEVDFLRDSLQVFIKELKKEKSLVSAEEDLLNTFDNLLRLNDSLHQEWDYVFMDKNSQIAINSFLRNVLKEYSELNDIQRKVAVKSSIQLCFNQVEHLLWTLDDLPQKVFAMKDVYTNKVFNAYTFTYMDEIVKAPIYKSFHEVLLPALFENLNYLSCINIKNYTENFNKVSVRMAELLNEETSKAERKIKREKDPVIVAEWLEMNLSFKE